MIVSSEVRKRLSQPPAVFALTCLLIGLAFAFPYRLIPEGELRKMSDIWPAEVGNLYAVTAWAGWAHFLYASRGQGASLVRGTDPLRWQKLSFYALVLAGSVGALFFARSMTGLVLFGGLVWVYFIDHFLKAERVFEGGPQDSRRWLTSSQPLVTFSWLSVVLLGVGDVAQSPWIVWGVSLTLAALVLVLGGWKALTSGSAWNPLLSLFFLGEALVWGTVYRHGESEFLSGVYVFHIAFASFYHYLGSYFFAQAKDPAKDPALSLPAIAALNIAVIALGSAASHLPALSFLLPVLSIEFFTLWVAFHLAASDLHPLLKKWKSAPVTA